MAHLRKTGFYRDFPPEGSELVSWVVAMSYGFVITLRVEPDKLRNLSRYMEGKAWGAFRYQSLPQPTTSPPSPRRSRRTTPPSPRPCGSQVGGGAPRSNSGRAARADHLRRGAGAALRQGARFARWRFTSARAPGRGARALPGGGDGASRDGRGPARARRSLSRWTPGPGSTLHSCWAASRTGSPRRKRRDHAVYLSRCSRSIEKTARGWSSPIATSISSSRVTPRCGWGLDRGSGAGSTRSPPPSRRRRCGRPSAAPTSSGRSRPCSATSG